VHLDRQCFGSGAPGILKNENIASEGSHHASSECSDQEDRTHVTRPLVGTSAASRDVITRLYLVIVKVLQTFRFYDARNDRYASLIRDLAGPSFRRDGLVLDLGCGVGGITARLRNGHYLLGVDADRFLLGRFVAPVIPRIQARAERLPIKSGRADLVVAISLVEHVANQAVLFREFGRILRSGGRAVLQIPELRFPFEPHTKWPFLLMWNPALQTRILQSTGYSDLNLATSREGVENLAVASGLQVGNWVPIRHFSISRIFRMAMGYFVVLTKP
jgi:SAM-dependent methyltransferase